ncbi:MAG: 4-hydroxy-3-methylbut-2-enyl diphosphate reductase [Clostridia bacterium]|nr:4-hydroxy-3-methylbut-2-enyl diphosphate reductase [Clostridia bacterium]
MTVTVAEKAGFCFGVERAVSKAFELSCGKDNETIYTVGSLIHNPHIINELKNRGVEVISSSDFEEIFSSASENNICTVVIRAHGVTEEISKSLNLYADRNPYFKVCDMTCPYVKKIHRIVEENRNRRLIIFGDETHPEVIGIKSYSESDAIVISSPEEALTLDIAETPVIAVTQTTQKPYLWEACQENIKKVCKDALIFDTICKVTEDRQKEAEELAKKSDLMIVIGGRESSNTKKLYETAKKHLDNTYLIEEASELKNINFSSYKNIGITAGASTPSSIIEEVRKMIEK